MLIATCNVNGIDGRLSNLLTWLKEAAPDVDCLQELKVPDEKLPEAAIGPAMARSGRAKELERRGDPGAGRPARGNSTRLAWRSRRHAQPLYRSSDRRHDRRMPLAAERQSRAGTDDYKLRWFDRLAAHAESLRATGTPVVLAGDYNESPHRVGPALLNKAAIGVPQLWPEGCVIDPSLWRVDVEIGWHHESATYHRGADRGA
jgi:exodeoxyribonuclease-3